MSNNFYSNDLMVRIRIEQRMTEAEAYRVAAQIEQSTITKQTTRHAAFRPVSWIRWLVVRVGGAGT